MRLQDAPFVNVCSLETKIVGDNSVAGLARLAKLILEAIQQRKINTLSDSKPMIVLLPYLASIKVHRKSYQNYQNDQLSTQLVYFMDLIYQQKMDRMQVASFVSCTTDVFSARTKLHFVSNEKLKDFESCLHIKSLSKTRRSARSEAIKAVWTSNEDQNLQFHLYNHARKRRVV